MKMFALFLLLVAGAVSSRAATPDAAARATNAFGIDLYAKVASGGGNLCLSPYSISCALAMTLEGAAGETRKEMVRVLHLDAAEDSGASFAALQDSLGKIAPQKVETGGKPIAIAVANRLFVQNGFALRPDFVAQVQKFFEASPELLDFKTNAAGATGQINNWVAKQTRERIRDLIPHPLAASTRLVLANALYFKAPWAEPFSRGATTSEPFHLANGATANVPMMRATMRFGYAKHDGFSAIAIPYSGHALQFLILLPDAADGLPQLATKLSADLLRSCAQLNESELSLHLPKFKFAPPTLNLTQPLEALGMKSAFDIPPGSADFSRMTQGQPNEKLAVSDVFHKTFIAVDENGTEAAAATVVGMRATAMRRPEPPVEVKIDRPFFYAVQDVASGVCLFVGRAADPR